MDINFQQSQNIWPWPRSFIRLTGATHPHAGGTARVSRWFAFGWSQEGITLKCVLAHLLRGFYCPFSQASQQTSERTRTGTRPAPAGRLVGRRVPDVTNGRRKHGSVSWPVHPALFEGNLGPQRRTWRKCWNNGKVKQWILTTDEPQRPGTHATYWAFSSQFGWVNLIWSLTESDCMTQEGLEGRKSLSSNDKIMICTWSISGIFQIHDSL